MKRIGSKGDVDTTPKPAAAPLHRELLLYVEDDENNWRVAELRLGKAYELLRAENAEAACRVLRARGADLAAILMDIELRGSELNGVELTKLIRGKRLDRALPLYAQQLPAFPHTPIIFVTAHGAKYSDAELVFSGGDKALAKPVDFGALSIALTQLHLSRAARTKRR